MSYLEISPITIFPSEFDAIERRIIEVLREEIYLPLLLELGAPNAIKNALEDVIDAITSSRISFYRGKFTGRFTSKVSKELKRIGATWVRSDSSWSIPQSSLPTEILEAIRVSESRINRVFERINERLSRIIPEKVAENVRIEKLFDHTLWTAEESLKKTLRKITVPPQLTPERREKIAEEYTENMKLYIKDWTEKEIVSLRKAMQEHSFKGLRYDGMIKEIQKSYGVGVRKAKFLARQETNLLMTTYKESRYKDSGISEYKWQCVKMPHDKSPGDHTLGNVRYFHGQLDGKVFRFDNPPVVDSKGSRKNPGQDYNCRCIARPIVRF